jgi:hypothetical protein
MVSFPVGKLAFGTKSQVKFRADKPITSQLQPEQPWHAPPRFERRSWVIRVMVEFFMTVLFRVASLVGFGRIGSHSP